MDNFLVLQLGFVSSSRIRNHILRISLHKGELTFMTIYIALLRGFPLFRHSIRNSKLANNLQKLDVPATVRNWKTINRLVALAKAMEI